MFDFYINISKSPDIDWVNVAVLISSSLLSAFVAIGIAYYNNKKQFQQFNNQLTIQHSQWKSDAFLKTKIETFLLVKRLFNKFQEQTLNFTGLFMPDVISFVDGNTIDYQNLDDRNIIPYFINSSYYNSFEEIVANNIKTVHELVTLLKGNEIFFRNNQELHSNLNSAVSAFREFYGNVIIKKIGVLQKVENNAYKRIQNKDFNEFFFQFLYTRLFYCKDKVCTQVFYFNKSNVPLLNNLSFEKENVVSIACNRKVLYLVSQSMQHWLSHLSLDIDKICLKYLPKEEIEVING